MTLGGSVGTELGLGGFTCRSVLVSPAADVLGGTDKETLKFGNLRHTPAPSWR